MESKTKIEIENNKTIMDLTLNNILLKRIIVKKLKGDKIDVKVYDIERGKNNETPENEQ